MVRTALLKMSGVLKFMITEGREWSSSRLVDAEQECLFAQGLICASTPKGLKRKSVQDNELETMMVSPIALRRPPKMSKMGPPRRIPMKRKLPVKRRLNFEEEKSFIAEKWEPTLPELMESKGISPKAAKELVDFAFSGNQECYHKIEKETGLTVEQLAEYADSDSPKSKSSGYTDFELTWRPDNTFVESSPEEIGGNPIHDTRTEETYRQAALEQKMSDFEPNISMPGNSSDNPILIIE